MCSIANRKENGGLADEEELALNELAQESFSGMWDPQLGKMKMDSVCLVHFKPVSTATKLKKLEQYLILFLTCLERVKSFMDQNQDRKNGKGILYVKTIAILKKNFNRSLNSLLSVLAETSPLKNLLFLNNDLKYVSKKPPHIKKHKDLCNPYDMIVGGHKEGEEDESGYVLRVNGSGKEGGGYIYFDTPEDCLRAMSASLEQSSNWYDVIKVSPPQQRDSGSVEPYGCFILVDGSCYKVRIFVAGRWIDTDNTRLIHILCNGIPPRNVGHRISPKSREFITLYPLLAEFLISVRKQIQQVLRDSGRNPNCPFTTIRCCRVNPPCNGETVIRKVEDGCSTLRICGECGMDLCGHGCGKIHHGDSLCEVSLDEASEALIRDTTKACPQCGMNTVKGEGCNHMTCRCRCEYCWLCGVEMPRDELGHYSTAGHFGVNGDGINGGCRQFAHRP